jgi:hypothetical protein
MSQITIWYTCETCGLTEQELTVAERKRAVDVVYWTKMVGWRAAQDHAERQPLCNAKTFVLTIPVGQETHQVGRNK